MEDAEKSLDRFTSKSAVHVDVKITLATITYTDNLKKQLSIGTRYLDCFKGVELRRSEISCLCFAGQILCGICFVSLSTTFISWKIWTDDVARLTTALTSSLKSVSVPPPPTLLLWMVPASISSIA